MSIATDYNLAPMCKSIFGVVVAKESAPRAKSCRMVTPAKRIRLGNPILTYDPILPLRMMYHRLLPDGCTSPKGFAWRL